MKTNSYFLFLLIYSLFISTSICAQNTVFNYLPTPDSNEIGYDIVEIVENKSFVASGSTRSINSSQLHGTISKFDVEGNLLETQILSIGNRDIYLHDILSKNDSLIFIGLIADTADHYTGKKNLSLLMYITDFELNPIDTLIHPYPLPEHFYSFQNYAKALDNGNIAIIGSVSDTLFDFARPKFFFFEFSAELDSIRSIYWPDSLGSGQDIKIMPNGDYWVILHGFNGWFSHYYVFDSSFNVKTITRIPNWISDPVGVKWNSDTTFFIVGEWDQIPDDNIGFSYQWYENYSDPLVNNTNTWGTEDSADYPAFLGGLDFRNQDSVFIGGVSHWYNYLYEISNYLFIFQMDSLLNIRWEKFYGGDAYYTMMRLITTEDGGCISVGSRYDYMNAEHKQGDLFILKVNDKGVIVGNPTEGPKLLREAIVYPNPGTNEINIRIATQHPESLFQLFDMNGKQIVSQEIIGKWGAINTGFLESGTYIYRITSKQGLFESGKWVKR